MKHPCARALVGAVLAAALPALSAQQARVVGKVVDGEGRPVEDAEVVLRSHGQLFQPELNGVHEIRARTRKNGRFRAEVFAGRRYSAWARLPGTAPRFTKIAEGVIAGRPVTLDSETFERRRIRIRPKGLEAWQHWAPFRFRCVSAALNFEQRTLSLGEDGTIELPDWPGSRLHVEILDKRGEPLGVSAWTYTAPVNKGGDENADDDVREWNIRPPLVIRVRVEPYESEGAPLVGARFRWHVDKTHSSDDSLTRSVQRDVERDLGVSDADGKLRIEIPVSRTRLYGYLIAHGPDRVLTAIGLRARDKSFARVTTAEDGSLDIKVRLKKGAAVLGRVLDAEGKGVAGLTLSYPRPAAIWFEKTSATWRTLSLHYAQTDSEGRFRFSPLMPGRRAVVTALPNVEQLARLIPGLDADQRVARSIVLDSRSTPASDKPVDLGDLRAEVRTLPVRITHNGRPAKFTRLFVLRSKMAFHEAPLDMATTNRRGEATLLAPSAAGQVLAIEKNLGYRIEPLSREPAPDESLEIQLQDFRWVEGRVVDTDGKPVPYASLNLTSESTRGPTRQFVRQINSQLRAQRTDAQGRFRFPFIPESNWSVSLRASVRRDGQSFTSSNQIQCPALDEDRKGLELTIDMSSQKKTKR